MLTKPSFFPQALFSHPFHTIHFADPADVARDDCMGALVTQMLDSNKKLQDVWLPSTRIPKEYEDVLNKRRCIRHDEIRNTA
jgi:hypothetical protein